MTTCLADTRCRGYDRRAQTAALVDSLPLCDLCLTSAEYDISQLPADYRDLEQQLPRSMSQWGDGLPGRSGEAPIPLRLAVEALQREIWYLATAWAEVLAGEHRLADPAHPVRAGRAVVDAVATIGVRVWRLAEIGPVAMVSYPRADPDDVTVFGTRTPRVGRYPRTLQLYPVSGAQGVLDLASAHYRSRSMLGLTNLVRHLPGRCQVQRCARDELYQEEPREFKDEPPVYCGHCGATMTRDDYERLGNVFA